jgi:D-mannonate dehydratase
MHASAGSGGAVGRPDAGNLRHGARLHHAATREVQVVAESFWDEGKVDMARAMRAYADCSYDGYLSPDHHPHVVGDTVWGHRSRGFALGYMRGLLQSVQRRC